MFVQDKIADMLTRIRNANQMKYATVEVLGSKMTLGIAEILKREGFIEDFKYEDALMVGDRKYDKTGADGLGIKCVLIEYGFGSREELEKCEPFSIQSTVSDLQKFLDSLIKRG